MRKIYSAPACAKINLGLRVLGLREDGYHELRTVFQTIRLADRVRLTLTSGSGLELECPPPSGPAADWLRAPAGEANLAWRAARLAAEAFGIRAHLHIELRKRIPIAAGLGGGSSDAATVLQLLAIAAPRRPSEAELWRLAVSLGSDVPFFLLGGAAVGLGRGEEVYPLPDLPAWPCVVVLPRQGGVETRSAYAAWDAAHPHARAANWTPELTSAKIAFCSSLLRALPVSRSWRDRGQGERATAAPGPKVRAGIANDLEEVVFPLSPDFRAIHRALAAAPVLWTGLSGSGAASFALFAARRQASHYSRLWRRWGPLWHSALLGRRAYQARLRRLPA